MDKWCPTCSKPVRISLDCFPALCSDCRQPYFVAQRPGGYAQGRADERAAVMVPRESIDEWRDLITDLVFDLGAHSRARKAVADLDALLKQGGG